MSTSTNATTDFPSPQDWKNWLEQILPGQGAWSDEQYLVLTDDTNQLVEFTDGFLEVLRSFRGSRHFPARRIGRVGFACRVRGGRCSRVRRRLIEARYESVRLKA